MRLTRTLKVPTINSGIVGTELTFFALQFCALLFWKHTRFYINQSGFRIYWASQSGSFDEIPQQLNNELKIKGYNLIHLKPVKPVKPPKNITWPYLNEIPAHNNEIPACDVIGVNVFLCTWMRLFHQKGEFGPFYTTYYLLTASDERGWV